MRRADVARAAAAESAVVYQRAFLRWLRSFPA
jgi:hypothetical protein